MFVLPSFLSGGSSSWDCQAVLDDYCNLDCFSSISDRPCDGPLVARFSGSDTSTTPQWRCYSPSTLDHNLTYQSGNCYCSRDRELQDILSLCFAGTRVVYAQGEGSDSCYRIPTIIQLTVRSHYSLLLLLYTYMYQIYQEFELNFAAERWTNVYIYPTKSWYDGNVTFLE